MRKEDLLPGIEEYLEKIDENAPIAPAGLDELVLKIRAATGIEKEVSKILTTYFFQEIRTQVLKNNTIYLKKLGRFSISNRNKKKIFAKFEPSRRLKSKLND